MDKQDLRVYILEQSKSNGGGTTDGSGDGGTSPSEPTGNDGTTSSDFKDKDDKHKKRRIFFGGGYGYWRRKSLKRSCSNCDNYSNGKCEVASKVIAKHGEENLNRWLGDPSKRNSCKYFTTK